MTINSVDAYVAAAAKQLDTLMREELTDHIVAKALEDLKAKLQPLVKAEVEAYTIDRIRLSYSVLTDTPLIDVLLHYTNSTSN